LIQHRRDEPAGHTPRSLGGRPDLEPRVEQVLREAEGAQCPLGAPPAPREEAIPVEVRRKRFDGRADVAEPERPPGPVTEEVETEQSQMVLGAGDADVQVAESHESRVGVQVVDVAVIQEAASRVQVHEGLEVPKRCAGLPELCGPHADIDVPVRPEPRFRIESGRGPALDQERLDAPRAKVVDDPSDSSHVQCGLNRVQPVGLLEV